MASASSLEDLRKLHAELEAAQAAVAEKEAEIAATQQASVEALKNPFSRSFDRTPIKAIHDSAGSGKSLVGATLTVGGWVRTGRTADKGAFGFLEVNDGSSPTNIQVLVKADVYDPDAIRQTGTCIVVEGELKAAPEGAKQVVELHATKVKHHGPCDGATYPMAKKKMNLEYLRDKIHLRTRTGTIGAVARIRNCLAYATHNFFQQNGFLYVHTPIITKSDCEGAGEMFQVTTLLGGAEEAAKKPEPTPELLAELRAKASEAGAAVKAAKEAAKNGGEQSAVGAALTVLQAAKGEVIEAEERAKLVGGLPRKEDGSIDYSKDFFSEPTYMTVSGQLQGEIYACALTSVYTFGPTFRAEDSHTSRHLAEFWMIEPEIAFADLEDNMACAEAYVRFCCQAVLDNCMPDLQFLSGLYDKTAVDRVKAVAAATFARCSYTEAVELLEKAIAGGRKFDYPVKWGEDLKSEHERYIAEEVFQKPTIVYNYPKEIKAFYMRLNEDDKTVAAMDVLVPGVGELIGGSQREERMEVLERRIEELGLVKEDYDGYLDLRRYGTCTHSGFGLGFERLILFTTGIENIRDVIPFPRWPGNCRA